MNKNYTCIIVLSKFFEVNSHSKRIKILSLLKKSEKFALSNKSGRFSLFWSKIYSKKV